MGIRFGEIDSNQILDNEFRIKSLERIVQWIINNNLNIVRPNQDDIKKIQQEVLAELQNKYPKSGVKIENK